jgi:hypothetical protein
VSRATLLAAVNLTSIIVLACKRRSSVAFMVSAMAFENGVQLYRMRCSLRERSGFACRETVSLGRLVLCSMRDRGKDFAPLSISLRERPAVAGAEGATAPETLRQKDRAITKL